MRALVGLGRWLLWLVRLCVEALLLMAFAFAVVWGLVQLGVIG